MLVRGHDSTMENFNTLQYYAVCRSGNDWDASQCAFLCKTNHFQYHTLTSFFIACVLDLLKFNICWLFCDCLPLLLILLSLAKGLFIFPFLRVSTMTGKKWPRVIEKITKIQWADRQTNWQTDRHTDLQDNRKHNNQTKKYWADWKKKKKCPLIMHPDWKFHNSRANKSVDRHFCTA